MKKQKQSRRFAWAGFSDGKLHAQLVDNGWGGFGNEKHPGLAIFLTRAEAKKQYRDVRKIEIIEVIQKNRKRP